MKKFGMIALAMILAFSMGACGRREEQDPTNNQTTTAPTNAPSTTAPTATAPATTEPTVMPDIPDMETNIPDPTVDSNSTEGMTDATQDTARSRNRNHRN